MERRIFLGMIAGGLLAAPLAAEAQQAPGKIPVIGLLDLSAPDAARLNWWNAFRQALRELGYVEGQSIRFEARWAQGRLDRLPDLAAELVRLRVDVIVTGGGETARAAKQATATVPIVMATGGDPVKLGVVESLARPGGNVTGVSSLSSQLIAKRMELLRALVPKDSRVGILWDETPNSRMSMQELEAAARALGIGVHPVGVRGPMTSSERFQRPRRTAP
jgi:putative ABC transport system substrate-binding protein